MTSCQGDGSLWLGPLQLAIGGIISYYHSVNGLIVVGVPGLETLIRIYSGMLVLLLPLKVSSLNQQTIYKREDAGPLGKGDTHSQAFSCMSKRGESCEGSLC